MGEATGERYRTLRVGGTGSLGVLIRVAKLVAPQPRATFPPWQGMQCMRDMFSGRGKLHPLDNGRHPGLRWTSVREHLAARRRPHRERERDERRSRRTDRQPRLRPALNGRTATGLAAARRWTCPQPVSESGSLAPRRIGLSLCAPARRYGRTGWPLHRSPELAARPLQLGAALDRSGAGLLASLLSCRTPTNAGARDAWASGPLQSLSPQ